MHGFGEEVVFFERRMKYGTVVYMCRVSEVTDYVKNMVASLRRWMIHERSSFRA